MPVKTRTAFVCRECGYETIRWLGRCPECGVYNTLEQTVSRAAPSAEIEKTGGTAVALKDVSVSAGANERIPTEIPELDRVLCGGIVQGSVLLLGGEPGIGKSTLLLQICKASGIKKTTALYVTGEESALQIKLRAQRLKFDSENVFLLPETDMDKVDSAIAKIKPDLLMIDSIQTMRLADFDSLPGSVTQVRECAARLSMIAKRQNIAAVLVGHVTKEGTVAGPRVLEHMVDAVLYFEGERGDNYRIVRAVKNRFGSTNEIGIFEMRDDGLHEIPDPSAYMLAGRPLDVSGSVVTCSVEGTRPILAEVQALVGYTSFGSPRRTATGVDHNRVAVLIAVLEKRMGYKLQSYDSFVSVAGGMRLTEPAADAGIVAALASCHKDMPVDSETVVFGEVGLAGELRAVNMAEKRVSESFRQGFRRCVVPQANLTGLKRPDGIAVNGVSNIGELLSFLI